MLCSSEGVYRFCDEPTQQPNPLLHQFSFPYKSTATANNWDEFMKAWALLVAADERSTQTADRTGKGEGGRGQGNTLFSCAREAERNLGIKPRPSTGSGTRFRMLRLGRSASSVTVFPLLPTPKAPLLHSDPTSASSLY